MEIWEKATQRIGRPMEFQDALELWEEACLYFLWCKERPLHSYEQTTGKGKPVKKKIKVKKIEDLTGAVVENEESHVEMFQEAITKVPKTRAFTWEGLCLWCGVSRSYFSNYKTLHAGKQGFLEVIEKIEHTIKSQQYEHAAAGLLKENIVARYLGMADNVKNEVSGPDGAPLKPSPLDDLTFEQLYELKHGHKPGAAGGT
jgi:hypothetical protein